MLDLIAPKITRTRAYNFYWTPIKFCPQTTAKTIS
jgi:hypothetical protein